MAEFRGGGGGKYQKFEKVGDRHEGTYVSSRTVANTFKAGTSNLVAEFVRKDGTKFALRLSQRALVDAWEQAQPVLGEYLILVFEKTYSTKYGNPGKEIFIDIPSRGSSAAPPEPKTGIEAKRQRLRELKGVQVADLMYAALETKYPDVAAREAALDELLKIHGGA